MNITFMNNTGAEIVGLGPSECVGKKCYDLFKTGDCNTDRCATKKAMDLGEICNSETVARPNEDSNTPIKYTGLPIKNHKGEITGGLEVIFNMSDIYSIANNIDESKNTLANIGNSLNKSVTTMSSSAEELSAQTSSVASVADQFVLNSKTMSVDAESVSTEISNVSKSTTEINQNIENANSSVSSLITSINDISQMIDHEDQIVEEAANNSQDILNSMNELVTLSKSIGEFVEIISDIAEQTNLLALNATIEAARAGEAGKGFAVVANEVKELSTMTEKTTNDIAAKVSEIQLAVNNSEKQAAINGRIAQTAFQYFKHNKSLQELSLSNFLYLNFETAQTYGEKVNIALNSIFITNNY
jgi:methyl-accepting chemotaxis protein